MKKIRAALAFAAALCSAGLAAQPQVPVWLPTRQEVATLTPQGLVLPSGRIISPQQSQQEYALGGERWVRTKSLPMLKPHEYRVAIQVIDKAGQIMAQKEWLTKDPYAGLPMLLATQRGPCIFWLAQDTNQTDCYTKDLQTKWASFNGLPLLVTQDGEWAFSTKWGRDNEIKATLPIERTQLTTGEKTNLTLSFGAKGQEAKTLEYLIANDWYPQTTAWQELSVHRLLVCFRLDLTKAGCDFSIIDLDMQRLYDFEVAQSSYASTPEPNHDSSLAGYLGNSLHLWEVKTGHFLRLISDDKRLRDVPNTMPLALYFAPDNRLAVAIYQSDSCCSLWHKFNPRAFVYDIQTGKRLTTFEIVSR